MGLRTRHTPTGLPACIGRYRLTCLTRPHTRSASLRCAHRQDGRWTPTWSKDLYSSMNMIWVDGKPLGVGARVRSAASLSYYLPMLQRCGPCNSQRGGCTALHACSSISAAAVPHEPACHARCDDYCDPAVCLQRDIGILNVGRVLAAPPHAKALPHCKARRGALGAVCTIV